MTGIVVGVDGSSDSLRALRWALEESVVRSAPLTVLSAYDPTPPVTAWTPDSVYVEVPHDSLEARQEALEELVSKVVVEWGHDRPDGLAVRAVVGGARELLLKAAETADLLVVGSRGASAIGRLLLGSVSSAVVHHAGCPVVVVPPSAQEDRDL
ncbi:MAG: universal stress protein [Mycobacteriales bacterium]